MLLEALSAGTITYLSWREERLNSFFVFKYRLLTQVLSLRIRPCTRDLIVLRILVYSLYPPGIIFNSIHNYLEIMFPIVVLRFSEFRTLRNHLSETLMLNDIQITSDYMSRWVVLKCKVGAVTSQRVVKVLFYVNILQRLKQTGERQLSG